MQHKEACLGPNSFQSMEGGVGWGGVSHSQICATAGARSTSPSESEGLWFAKCVQGRGIVEEEGKGKERFG